MNKKGDTLIVALIISLVLVLISGGLVFISAKLLGSTDTILKVNTAEDLRMMVNLLAGIPGDAKVQYPTDVSTLSLTMDTSRIAVFKAGDPQQAWVTRSYHLPQGYTAQGNYQAPGELCLEKQSTKIIMQVCT
jgi:hypothetical protein